MIRYNFILVLLVFLTRSILAQPNSGSDSLTKISVNQFIEEWHKNATEADLAYFDKIASDGIYIGTDASELWTKDEFVNWSKKYFDRGKAWSFTTIERNIYNSKGVYVWFDELLNTGMGICRASGLVRIKGDSWEIAHYHLSIAVPNKNVDELKKIIEGQ